MFNFRILYSLVKTVKASLDINHLLVFSSDCCCNCTWLLQYALLQAYKHITIVQKKQTKILEFCFFYYLCRFSYQTLIFKQSNDNRNRLLLFSKTLAKYSVYIRAKKTQYC